MLNFRMKADIPKLRGRISHRDARLAGRAFPSLKEQVSLVVTSPPYLDTTDYNEDQWLRLWFLGGADEPHAGANKDDRHTRLDKYWTFLEESWNGLQPLVKNGTHLVVRIGGTKMPKGDLHDGLLMSLKTGLNGYRVGHQHGGTTTEIVNRQTNSFRPGTSSKRYEHDFVFKISG